MYTAPTNMSQDWIARVVANNPWADLGDGVLRTPPSRVSFPHVDKPQAAMEEGGKDKYTATFLLLPGSDDMALKNQCAKVGQEQWGDQFVQLVGNPNFHKPFKMQDEKAGKYEGYVPGLPYFTASGERKPSFVMQNMAPYTGLIYPGMWVFGLVRPFTFETKNKQGVIVKRGIGVGLQSLMFIADDKEFGGSSVDVQKGFAGVNIEANVNPNAAFAQTGAAPQQVAAAGGVFG